MPATRQPPQSEQTTTATVPVVAPVAAPPPPALTPVATDPYQLQRQYVSGGSYGWLGNVAHALTGSIDDLTAEFGREMYERMARDPQVAACIQVLKASVVEEGIQFAPAVQDSADPDYARAVALADELTAEVEDLQTGSDDVLLNLLDALSLGNRLAEVQYEYAPPSAPSIDLPPGKILRLAALTVRPAGSTAYVVDGYMRLVGVLAQELNQPSPILNGWVIDTKNPPPNLLGPEKFLIYTFRPQNNDPRGTSLLRAAHTPWWLKQQLLPEYRKYLAQFAGGMVWGTPPENTESGPVTLANADGTFTTQTPEQVLLSQLLNWRNGAAAAFPYGTGIHVEWPQGDGRPFLSAWALCDAQITKAILTQSLATEEGAHQARAAAEVHQDVLDTLIRQTKRGLARAFYQQVVKVWMRVNWGDKSARLAPRVNLGSTERHDLAAMMTAVATLAKANYLHASQLPATDQLLGLPVRDLTQDDQPADAADQSTNPATAGQESEPDADDAPAPDGDSGAATDTPSGLVRVRPHTRRRRASAQEAIAA